MTCLILLIALIQLAVVFSYPQVDFFFDPEFQLATSDIPPEEHLFSSSILPGVLLNDLDLAGFTDVPIEEQAWGFLGADENVELNTLFPISTPLDLEQYAFEDEWNEWAPEQQSFDLMTEAQPDSDSSWLTTSVNNFFDPFEVASADSEEGNIESPDATNYQDFVVDPERIVFERDETLCPASQFGLSDSPICFYEDLRGRVRLVPGQSYANLEEITISFSACDWIGKVWCCGTTGYVKRPAPLKRQADIIATIEKQDNPAVRDLAKFFLTFNEYSFNGYTCYPKEPLEESAEELMP